MLFFVETSAVIEYTLWFDKSLCGIWTETVTTFLGFLKSKNVPVVISKTAFDEAVREIPNSINHLIDKLNPHRRGQLRALMINKSRERFRKFHSNVTVLSLQGDVGAVNAFYKSLLNDKTTKAKLEQIRQFKHRARILPEDSDMLILSEAISLVKKNETHFISKDEDFCAFKDEIKAKFDISIEPVQTLLTLRDNL